MISTYLLIAALAFLALYFAIKKLNFTNDEKALLEPAKSEIYPEFCDIIDDRLRDLKNRVQNDSIKLKDSDSSAEFLEKLGDLSRELTFIQTMNLSKKNDELWQSELFEFLSKLDELILTFLEEGQKESEELREFLMSEFKRLKEK